MASPPAPWKDYFDNPTLSDLTIRLSDRVVHVHRIVLCCGSEYFEKLLTGNFKASHLTLAVQILCVRLTNMLGERSQRNRIA